MRSVRRLVATTSVAVMALTTAAGTADATGNKRPTIVELAVSNPDLSSLVAAVQKAGLVDTLAGKGRFTVFAPNNAAFAALLNKLGFANLDAVPVDALKGILLDHVIGDGRFDSHDLRRHDFRNVRPVALGGLALNPDGAFNAAPLTINGINVIAADNRASNGIVHVIDAVLLDPDPRPSIADLAIATPSLSTLVAALTKAGLVDVVNGNGSEQFTVFAPNNDAFAKLLAALGYSSLDQVPVDALKAILLDHVIVGERSGDEVLAGVRLRAEGSLRVRVTSTSPLQVNGINVIATDIKARNGVVHVIDQVLIQPARGH
jgi:transforming growth factor-beta-induced protein